jgi:hypothetical protein
MRYRVVLVSLWLIAISEMFLNFISFKILIPGYGLLYDLMRVILAVILTAISIKVSEKFFEVVMPIQKYGQQKTKQWIEKPQFAVYFIVLIGVSFVIFAISGKRAADIEGQSEGLVYWGFIGLSILLPIVGGLLWRDLLSYKDAYSNSKYAQKLNNKSDKLKQKITSLENKYKNVVNRFIAKYWDELNTFRVYKENYNDKHGVTSSIEKGHYALNYNEFKNEAVNHYRRVEDESITENTDE